MYASCWRSQRSSHVAPSTGRSALPVMIEVTFTSYTVVDKTVSVSSELRLIQGRCRARRVVDRESPHARHRRHADLRRPRRPSFPSDAGPTDQRARRRATAGLMLDAFVQLLRRTPPVSSCGLGDVSAGALKRTISPRTGAHWRCSARPTTACGMSTSTRPMLVSPRLGRRARRVVPPSALVNRRLGVHSRPVRPRPSDVSRRHATVLLARCTNWGGPYAASRTHHGVVRPAPRARGRCMHRVMTRRLGSRPWQPSSAPSLLAAAALAPVDRRARATPGVGSHPPSGAWRSCRQR